MFNITSQQFGKYLGTVLIIVTVLMVSVSVNVTKVHATPPPYTTTTSVLMSDPGSGVESAIATDPSNSSRLVDGSPGFFYGTSYSADGGATWTNNGVPNGWCSVPGSSTCLGRNDPSVAIGPDGTDYSIMYFSNYTLSEIYMMNSTNHGATWNVDMNYFASNSNLSKTTWTFLNGTTTTGCAVPNNIEVVDYAKIGVDDGASSPYRGYIYIVGDFGILQNGGCVFQNGLVRSTDGGKTWGLHLITSPTYAGAREIEQIQIGPTGELYFARVDGQTGNVFFDKSTNAGATWSYSEISVSHLIATSVNLAVSSTGTLYIVYGLCLSTTCQGTTPGTSALYLITSTNDGSTWSSATQITDSNAVPYYVDPCMPPPTTCYFTSHSPPAITITPQGLAVAWRDWRNSSNNTNADIYAYIPSLGSANIRLTTLTGRLCIRADIVECTYGGNDFLTLTSYPRAIFFAYGMDTNGDGNPDIVVTKLTFPAFSMTTSPTSVSIFCNFYGCDPGQTVNANVTIQSLNGFGGTVTLTYTGPTGPYVTGPSSATVSAGGSTTVTITAHARGATSGNFTWTITGTITGFSTSTTLTISYIYCKNCQ